MLPPTAPPQISASSCLSTPPVCHHGHHDRRDSDLVPLKISLLGDSQIGNTSFLLKYIGDENGEEEDNQEKGLNLMNKTFIVSGARIYYIIWVVDGAENIQDHIPLACKDSVAILFMLSTYHGKSICEGSKCDAVLFKCYIQHQRFLFFVIVSGDIVFVLQQKDHPRFKRKGEDLFVEHIVAYRGFVWLPVHNYPPRRSTTSHQVEPWRGCEA